MEIPLSQLRSMALPRPARGQSARWRVGRIELVLEAVRGGYSLLCLDGTRARSWSLGLAENGELRLSCRVPRLPIALGLKDTLVLVPGGRVRGFVQVDLVPTVVWRAAPAPGARQQADETVAELLPDALTAEWDDALSACVQRATSPLFQRLPPPAEVPRALVPLRVRNDGAQTQSPATLPLELADDELRECRGHLMARPRRVCLEGGGRATTEVRALRAPDAAAARGGR